MSSFYPISLILRGHKVTVLQNRNPHGSLITAPQPHGSNNSQMLPVWSTASTDDGYYCTSMLYSLLTEWNDLYSTCLQEAAAFELHNVWCATVLHHQHLRFSVRDVTEMSHHSGHPNSCPTDVHKVHKISRVKLLL